MGGDRGSGNEGERQVRTLRYTATRSFPRIVDEQGYTLSRIAREVGKSRGFVSLVARGKRTVGEEEARQIARFFRLPLDVLFQANE